MTGAWWLAVVVLVCVPFIGRLRSLLRPRRLLLITAVALLALLYARGLLWDLRYDKIWHPDFPKLVSTVQQFDRGPFADFGDLRYPTFYPGMIYLTRATIAATFGSAPAIPLLLRLASLGLAALSLLLLYRLARRHFGDHPALLATGLLALCPALVVSTHYGMTDLPLTACAIWLLSLYLQQVRVEHLPWHRFALLGLALGLATAIKYSGALLAAPLLPLAAIWLRQRRASWPRVVSGLVLTGLTAAAVFVTLVPSALYDGEDLLSALRYERLAASTLYYGLFIKESHPLASRALFALGVPLALLCGVIVGRFVYQQIAALVRRRPLPADAFDLLLLGSPALIVGYYATYTRVWFWYFPPLLPLLALFVAKQLAAMHHRRLVAGICAAVGVLALTTTWALVTPYAAGNTRITASQWARQELPAGATIAFFEEGWKAFDTPGLRRVPWTAEARFRVVARQIYQVHRAAARGEYPDRMLRWRGRTYHSAWFPGQPPAPAVTRLFDDLAHDRGFRLRQTIAAIPRVGPWAPGPLPYEFEEIVSPVFLVFERTAEGRAR